MSDSNLATAQSFLYEPAGPRGAFITRPMENRRLEASRGRIVGNIMGGLTLGIL
jgi:hypothetical protein